MQHPETTKRKYFTKAKKLKILSELASGDMTHSELARKHGIHPITIHAWKRIMRDEKPKQVPDYQEILDENSELKTQIENLKKALGEVAVDKQILQTANDILKKSVRQKQSDSQKKSSKN